MRPTTKSVVTQRELRMSFFCWVLRSDFDFEVWGATEGRQDITLSTWEELAWRWSWILFDLLDWHSHGTPYKAWTTPMNYFLWKRAQETVCGRGRKEREDERAGGIRAQRADAKENPRVQAKSMTFKLGFDFFLCWYIGEPNAGVVSRRRGIMIYVLQVCIILNLCAGVGW